jgi:oligopeptidase B
MAMPASFNANRLSLVDRGFVYAIAHIRGGTDKGWGWYLDGKREKKTNSFDDFAASARALIDAQYTSAKRIVGHGGSAGGMLMGAVANRAGELFAGIVAEVPFVDVLNTMLDESLPLTVGEFEEWGNPRKKEEYEYIRSYSPYDNLAAKAYPTMLVKTSFDDSQVMYWEPAKYVAKLRSVKTDANPLVFKINMAGGHGGSSGRYDRLRELAFDYAFVLTQLGLGPAS